jgi:CheY-like chemotaxis protein/signal transduction histidine kinase/HAMP domain-containing protein
VGTEGKLGGQAQVRGVGGTWKDLTDNVNSMAGNLTAQVRNIAEVTTAVARGELNKKITVDVKGEILELKNTINTMVDQLNSFASEVTRVAREVGTEGKLGGQAQVVGVAGVWKDLTDNVNSMGGNLTAQVRNIAQVTTAVANGDLSKKITVDVRGEILELKDTINTMVDQLNSFASEVTRVAREVGTEGKLGGQAYVKGVAGTWKDLTDNVNSMAGNLTAQVRNIADVTTAVARGELNKKITVDVQGEILELKNTVNTMVDQLNSFASEVTRVAREVGTEGKLGGQAQVVGVAGVWKDLTDNVNWMASNLTSQVRGIAKVVTAVANGDLKQELRVEVKGEIATLADTINAMTSTLATFADQVTNVAREVGVEGKLGGQARVPGAAGVWRDLTANVNQLAANLTTQVRAIADVATAVTKGDLTRSIAVEALGEVAELKDNINEMIRNLRDSTRKNMEQDWLKTNLAKFSRMLQGQRDLSAVSQLILSDLAPLVTAHHGVFYVVDSAGETPALKLLASYAYKDRKHVADEVKWGEGLVGQVAKDRRMLTVGQVPHDYIQVNSGLGEAPPRSLVVLPVLFEGETKAVLELATFDEFDEIRLTFLEQLAESIGIVLNTIAANMRTEELLKQSQALTESLQAQQEALTETNKRLEQQTRSLQKSEELLRKQQDELQSTNAELEVKAQLLASQKAEVEQKNKEVEQAKVALEEKAEQLALISKYKSEFLANMSHELRTPLNSLLILSQILTENADGNLTTKQVGFAQTIHSSGSDLLDLINDILDLSKIESGTMAVDIAAVPFVEVRKFVESTFRQVADLKSLHFDVVIDPLLPPALQTDTKRLQQVLKNLLSNAFKFTERGSVSLRASLATGGWNPEQELLNSATGVVAFSVVDTGIGIPREKHGVIFEAFQQGDTGTSRKYGGTGLGLSISRQITRLLGGEIRIDSAPGEGSTFTLYLPLIYPIQPGTSPAIVETEGEGHGAVEPAKPAASAASRIMLAPVVERAIADDRSTIEEGDRVLLIAEDDPAFAQILLDLARDRGFKGIVAQRADRALALAREYQPTAVTLDLRLPDADGWTILDRLKHDPATRHIPVHIISVDENWQRGLRLGAIDFLTKPATKESLGEALTSLHEFIDRPVKRLLVVEDDETAQRSIAELIGGGDVQTTTVGTGAEALEALQSGRYDCMVLDLGLPDMTGFQLITRVKSEIGLRKLPTIVYTGKQLSKREEAELGRLAESVVIKDACSPERLLDETALFLHRVTARLPEGKRRMLEQLHRSNPTLTGRTVLIVDDDVRNIFALTTFLERSEMKVVYAESGRDGIARLQETPEVDVMLMDVMMPEMDGYETMRAIRDMPRFRQLPIIAVTAKAMKGDREKCIEAGASDYIAKPVDMEQLLSLLRVWLYR